MHLFLAIGKMCIELTFLGNRHELVCILEVLELHVFSVHVSKTPGHGISLEICLPGLPIQLPIRIRGFAE